MTRLVLALTALSALFLQATVSSALSPGTYVIRDYQENTLAIGAVAALYPPPDVHIRVVQPSLDSPEQWVVEEVEGGEEKDKGGFTIAVSPGGGQNSEYKIVQKEDSVFASAVSSQAQTWTVTLVEKEKEGEGEGEGEQDQYVISVVGEDRVFTSKAEDYSEVGLEQADGTERQRWTFVSTLVNH